MAEIKYDILVCGGTAVGLRRATGWSKTSEKS